MGARFQNANFYFQSKKVKLKFFFQKNFLNQDDKKGKEFLFFRNFYQQYKPIKNNIKSFEVYLYGSRHLKNEKNKSILHKKMVLLNFFLIFYILSF